MSLFHLIPLVPLLPSPSLPSQDRKKYQRQYYQVYSYLVHQSSPNDDMSVCFQANIYITETILTPSFDNQWFIFWETQKRIFVECDISQLSHWRLFLKLIFYIFASFYCVYSFRGCFFILIIFSQVTSEILCMICPHIAAIVDPVVTFCFDNYLTFKIISSLTWLDKSINELTLLMWVSESSAWTYT